MIHKLLLGMMALFSWLNLTQVFAVSCGLGVVVEHRVSHVDDQLWFLFPYSEEIWFTQHIGLA